MAIAAIRIAVIVAAAVMAGVVVGAMVEAAVAEIDSCGSCKIFSGDALFGEC
jgi:hypothetical protein